LKASLALNVFTLENLVKSLNANHVNLALSFIPIVPWRVAVQAVNISSRGRIHLVGMAFDIVQQCYSLYQTSQLTEKLPEGLGKGQQGPVFLVRDDDMLKQMVFLVTHSLVIALGVPYTALGRLGMAELEHLFGMTRLAPGLDSHMEKLCGRIVKSHFATRIAEQAQVTIGKKKSRHVAGVVHEGDQGKIDVTTFCPDVASILSDMLLHGDNVRAWESYRSLAFQFACLRERVVDRQKEQTVTCLGGVCSMPKILTARSA
jgi:hypothetical protein